MGRGRLGLVALLACLACTTTPYSPLPAPDPTAQPSLDAPADLDDLQHEPLDPLEVRVQPEGRTVGGNVALHLYTWFHRRNYSAYRLEYPGHDGDEVVAHLLLPPGDGPHAAVVVFPILGGTHTTSEALSKVLVNRGYAALRLERRPLPLATSDDPDEVARALRGAVLDARRLLDWADTHPHLDRQRVAAAGVSIGSFQAVLLAAADPRVRGGFLALTGGGLAEILHDSTERPVRVFRDRLISELDLETREDFLGALRPHTEVVEPLRYAGHVERGAMLMASGRSDRVIPPARAEALWSALGQPTWLRVPGGHYQFLPFFYWVAGRGVDHLDALLETGQEVDETAHP